MNMIKKLPNKVIRERHISYKGNTSNEFFRLEVDTERKYVSIKGKNSKNN